MVDQILPRYPAARVRRTSRKPLALLAATRFALRRAGVGPAEMEQFLQDAAPAAEASEAGADSLERVCARWASLEDH